MSNLEPLQSGDHAYWWNSISLDNRPVVIIKVTTKRYVVQTNDGHRYSPPRSMISREPVQI